MSKVRVVQFGCGPIGRSIIRYATVRPDMEVVGAIDTDSGLVGRDLGELAGIGDKLGVPISAEADDVLTQAKPDVVFLTTGSSLIEVHTQVAKCIDARANLISTCEELAYPYRTQPEISADIERRARDKGVTVLATGVNPGFVMDAWPLFMTGICQQIRRVKAVRIQDASPRRGPFQKKIGAGLMLDEFNKLVARGTLKHVGLPESIAMIASGLGWELDEIGESIEPVVAQCRAETDFVVVEPGQAAGVRQVGRGIRAGDELITLEFEAYVGAPESYDAVYITGTPSLEVVIKGGTPGDIATAAITVNCVHRVMDAPPGLLTMRDLPIISGPGSSA
jgi:4-hydroxy-tetrahydrodipicolinate reductase